MRSLLSTLLPIAVLIVPATSHAALPENHCSSLLDQSVALHNQGNSKTAHEILLDLAPDCSHLPQIQHNLGVLAATKKNWDRATNHFRLAIADDHRTGMTQQHLQAIHQFKAAESYGKSIGINSKQLLPELAMQDSTVTNLTPQHLPKTELHTISTLEYELYSWWQAAASDAADTWLEHYVPGFPAKNLADAKLVKWQQVEKQISFTAQDAVAVISYRVNSADQKRLLLLRLRNNRWQIYQENLL